MFNTISMGGTGLFVYAIAFLLQWAGIAGIDSNAIVRFVDIAAQVIGALLAFFGHARRKDVTSFFWKE